MVEICGGGKKSLDIEAMAEKVNFTDFLERDINAGFSGGEIKRSELLQLMAQEPDLMLFDEPESGVDMENITLIGTSISHLLQRDIHTDPEKSQRQIKRERNRMGLIITHTGFILDYVTADKGQVLYQGFSPAATTRRTSSTASKKWDMRSVYDARSERKSHKGKRQESGDRSRCGSVDLHGGACQARLCKRSKNLSDDR